MDKSAIEQIQTLAVQAVYSENLGVVDTPLALLHKDFQVQSLEKYMAARTRLRGSFSTYLPDEFARYFAQNKAEGTAVFINPDGMQARAIFNLGNQEEPGHCDHIAKLALKATREYQALMELDMGAARTQRDMANWFEDWRYCITAYDSDGNEIGIKRVIAAIRHIEISASYKADHQDGDFNAKKTTMEQVETSSRHTLPESFLFSCNPYHGLMRRDIHVRLYVVTGGEKPKLGARIVSKELVIESVQNEFSLLINETFEKFGIDGHSIFIGEFNPE